MALCFLITEMPPKLTLWPPNIDQLLPEYLSQAQRLFLSLPRLVPPPRGKTEASASAKTFTTGRTDINGKYYPIKLCPWPEFPQLRRDAFARIWSTLADQRDLPSIDATRHVQESVLEELPEQFRTAELFFNELKTSFFLHESLQKPASKIMNAYLKATVNPERVYFDNRTSGVVASCDTVARLPEGNNTTTAENAIASAPKIPRKTQPDCVVLRADPSRPRADVQRPGSSAHELEDGQPDEQYDSHYSISRVVLGEHKANHRLRTAAVSRFIGSIPEDFTIQLARSRLARASNPDATDAPEEIHDEFLEEDAVSAVSGKPRSFPHGTYFIYAIVQTFHYLLMSGLEYGYMMSGETITFLRLSEDGTTLFYYTALFSDFGQDESDVIDPTADLATFSELAISQLCSLCLMALEAPPRPLRWAGMATALLAQFPKLPPGFPSRLPSPAVSAKTRRRDDRDHGDHGDDGLRRKSRSRSRGRSSSRGGGRAMGEGSARPGQPNTSMIHGPSPLQQTGHVQLKFTFYDGYPVSHPNALDPSTFKPILSHCTHACLRGLVRGEELDRHCPNVLIHEQAWKVLAPLSEAREPRHVLTNSDICEQVCEQLVYNTELDCQIYPDEGHGTGTIGSLFKITLTGYGYTFVAKGVQEFDVPRLRHEMRIYRKLTAEQGRLIPVNLGLIKLILPYLLPNFRIVTHMMLLSYAGEPLYSSRLQRRLRRTYGESVNLDVEERRTDRELRALGLFDHDLVSNGNAMWCEETHRVMRIDFDHAVLADVPVAAPEQDEQAWQRRPGRRAFPETTLVMSPRMAKRAAAWDLEMTTRPAKKLMRDDKTVCVDALLLE